VFTLSHTYLFLLLLDVGVGVGNLKEDKTNNEKGVAVSLNLLDFLCSVAFSRENKKNTTQNGKDKGKEKEKTTTSDY